MTAPVFLPFHCFTQVTKPTIVCIWKHLLNFSTSSYANNKGDLLMSLPAIVQSALSELGCSLLGVTMHPTLFNSGRWTVSMGTAVICGDKNWHTAFYTVFFFLIKKSKSTYKTSPTAHYDQGVFETEYLHSVFINTRNQEAWWCFFEQTWCNDA